MYYATVLFSKNIYVDKSGQERLEDFLQYGDIVDFLDFSISALYRMENGDVIMWYRQTPSVK